MNVSRGAVTKRVRVGGAAIRIGENRAEVVLAEAEVPRAIARAFHDGQLGLLDYYELQNVQADTKMRIAIAGGGEDSAPAIVADGRR